MCSKFNIIIFVAGVVTINTIYIDTIAFVLSKSVTAEFYCVSTSPSAAFPFQRHFLWFFHRGEVDFNTAVTHGLATIV